MRIAHLLALVVVATSAGTLFARGGGGPGGGFNTPATNSLGITTTF